MPTNGTCIFYIEVYFHDFKISTFSCAWIFYLWHFYTDICKLIYMYSHVINICYESYQLPELLSVIPYDKTCADLEGGSGGSGPPLEFGKLNIADIIIKKSVIFHICALPQLYVKVGPPLEKFLDPRLQDLELLLLHIFFIFWFPKD